MAGACCGCDAKSFRLSVMLFMTFSYFIIEIVVGYMTHSMALVADSFHMLSDVLALCIAFACMKIAKRRSMSNTFGWVRAEILGALVNAVFLLALCFTIFVEALKRLVEPEGIVNPSLILVVGSVGLLVNIIGIFLFHSHASMSGHGHSHSSSASLPASTPVAVDNQVGDDRLRESFSIVAAEAHSVSVMADEARRLEEAGEEMIRAENGLTGGEERQRLTNADTNAAFGAEQNGKKGAGKHAHSHDSGELNMHGVFLHILGDAFGSVIVIINALVNWQVENETLGKYLDPSLSLVMVLIIMSTTAPLLKETALILLQTTPKYLNLVEMKEQLLKLDGVIAIHEFHVWRLAGQKIIATIHVRFRSLADYLTAADKIKTFFHDRQIHSTTIQPEFAEMVDGAAQAAVCYLRCPADAACDTETQRCCTTASASAVEAGAADATGSDEDASKTATDTSSSLSAAKARREENVMLKLKKVKLPEKETDEST